MLTSFWKSLVSVPVLPNQQPTFKVLKFKIGRTHRNLNLNTTLQVLNARSKKGSFNIDCEQMFWFVMLSIWSLSSSLQIFRSGSIMPVFHNVQSRDVKDLFNIIDKRFSCTLSLRHPDAISSLSELCKLRTNCIIGASTVSSAEKVQQVSKAGGKFISTMTVNQEVLDTAKRYGLPVLSGVSSLSDCEDAIRHDTDALKFYPASTYGADYFAQVLKNIRQSHSNNDLPIFIAGGVTAADFEPYLSVDDTVNFIVGFDFAKMTAEDIYSQLSEMEKTLSEINLRFRIKCDLKNSCL